MKTAGIITEYNPFHEGHSWQLREVRRLAGADFIVVFMSGDFVQRGEPAIFDKFARAEAALLAGADLVLELPVACATGSAQRFAEGAVALASGLGAVDELWFGTEAGELDGLTAIAGVLAAEPDFYKERLRGALAEGLPFPAARERALVDFFAKQGDGFTPGTQASDPLSADVIGRLLSTPNNSLGLEYLLALSKNDSKVTPRTHGRTDTASATALRRRIFEAVSASGKADAASDPGPVLPSDTASLCERAGGLAAALCADDFSSELRYQLLREDEQSLAGYLDVPEDLARRIIKHMHVFESFSQFTELLDTKNRTRTAVSRALLHVLLGITPSDLDRALAPSFARILGMRNCDALLSEIKKAGGLPLVANPAGAHEEAYARDLFASTLYETALAAKLGRAPIREYSRKLLHIIGDGDL